MSVFGWGLVRAWECCHRLMAGLGLVSGWGMRPRVLQWVALAIDPGVDLGMVCRLGTRRWVVGRLMYRSVGGPLFGPG